MIWVQADAPQLVRRWLRKQFPADADLFVSQLPEGWTRDSPPVVTVVSDGTPVAATAHTTENVRVMVRARDAPTARAIASRIDAALLTPRIGNAARGFRIEPGPGLMCIKDSRVGGWLAATTYLVTTRKKVGN